jgi:hypothetical protein
MTAYVRRVVVRIVAHGGYLRRICPDNQHDGTPLVDHHIARQLRASSIQGRIRRFVVTDKTLPNRNRWRHREAAPICKGGPDTLITRVVTSTRP